MKRSARSSRQRVRTSARTAALLGAAVLLFSGAVRPSCGTQAGPSFIKGRAFDVSSAGAGPADRLSAARTDTVRSGSNRTFFAAAMFPAAMEIRYGHRRGRQDETWTVAAEDSRIKIREEGDGGWSVNDGDGAKNPAPAAWLLLCETRSGAVLDAAVLDPEQTYDFSGAPVYWLGNLAGEESLAFIERLFRTEADADVREKTVFLISCHAAPRAYDILKAAALEDREPKVRRSAVFWIGTSSDARALAGLKDVFRKERNPDVREHVVFSLSLRKEKEAVLELIRIAREEAGEVRGKAVFWLGQKASAESVKALKDIAQSPSGEDKLKEQAVFAISQLPREKGVPILLDIARTHGNPRVRKQAIFWLGQSDDPAALKLFEEILLKK